MLTQRQFAKQLLISTVRVVLLLGLILLVLSAAIVVAAMVLESLQIDSGQTGRIIRDTSYWLISGAPAFLVGAWILFFGAALGSFMNVVVYRMPLGKSVTTRASHCPCCKTPILARDNIPVIGWILLNGRCRACRLPISMRYPIVEAVSGLIVFGLIVAVLFLPAPNCAPPPGAQILRYGFDAELYASGIAQRFLLQSLVLLTLLCSALIRWDRHPVPLKLVLGAWLGTGLAAIIFPAAVPVAAWPPGMSLAGAGSPGSLAIIVQVLFAGMAGTIAGAIAGARLKVREGVTVAFSMDCAFGLGLLAVAVGWQFAMTTGLLFAGLLTLWRIVLRQSSGHCPARLFGLLGIAFGCCVFWGYEEILMGRLPTSITPLWQLPLWMIPLSLPAWISLLQGSDDSENSSPGSTGQQE